MATPQLWRDTVAEVIPDQELRIWPEPGNFADIEYLAFIRPDLNAHSTFKAGDLFRLDRLDVAM